MSLLARMKLDDLSEVQVNCTIAAIPLPLLFVVEVDIVAAEILNTDTCEYFVNPRRILSHIFVIHRAILLVAFHLRLQNKA